jgi:mannose-1-phosphate guanylyltransferase
MNMPHGGTWTVVLAAGDGSRLSQLTTTEKGETIPKQFCSLASRECLLELALQRAMGISCLDQICTIVAAKHRRWWREPLTALRPGNIVVQPQNRGTAVGTALSLLRVEKHDPNATVVLLPADHFVEDEETLSRSLAELAAAARDDSRSVYLLGAEPDAPDSELGYIVPLGNGRTIRSVSQFVEKPSLDDASRLMADGALWNMFIVAGSVNALLAMLELSITQKF